MVRTGRHPRSTPLAVLTLLATLMIIAFSPAAFSQTQCASRGTLTTTGSTAVLPNSNTNPNCNAFVLTWNSHGFSAMTIQLEGTDDITGASGWTAFSGTSTVLVGTNPQSTLSGAIAVQASTKLAYIRAHVTSVTSTGGINVQIYGGSGITAVAGKGAPASSVSWANVTPGTNSQGFLQVHSPTILEPTPMSPGGIYATQVVDGNDLPAITITTPAGPAIDYFTFATSLGGGGATITMSPTGADASVNMLLSSKGSGDLQLNSTGLQVDTTGAMTAGTGTSIGPTGSGVVNANEYLGVAYTVQGTATKFQASVTGVGNQCMQYDSSLNASPVGYGCGAANTPHGTASFTFSSAICDGCCSAVGSTISIVSAALGDSVAVGANPAFSTGIELHGKVTGSGVVTVEVCNYTGGPVTPGATTYGANVIHALI